MGNESVTIPPMPTPSHSPDPGDTIERFVTDLGVLREQHPDRPTYLKLARMARRSKSGVHAATTNTEVLPSHDTLRALVGVLAPADVDQWLERRRRLAARPPALQTLEVSKADLSPPDSKADNSVAPPTPSRRPGFVTSSSFDRRIAFTAAVALAVFIGGVLTTPLDRGGVNTVAFCLGNYPRADGRSGQIATGGTWSSWHCQLDDNTLVSIDFQLACIQQYPAAGPFGGAQFALHSSLGHTSWRCYGSLVHNW